MLHSPPAVALGPRTHRRGTLPAVLLVGGATFIGVGVSLALASGLGAGPWDVLHEGLARTLGVDVGLVALLVGLGAFTLWFPLGVRPGIGTPVAVVVVAAVVHLLHPFVSTPEALPLQLAMSVTGVLATGIGVAACIRSGLGTGPRDGIALGLTRFGAPLWSVRIAVDVTLVGIGFLLGGTFGVGTLLEAFTVGPVIAATLAFADLARVGTPA